MVDPVVLESAKQLAAKNSLRVLEIETSKPWGGWFIFDPSEVREFAAAFFHDIDISKYGDQLGRPKFLFVAPHEKLSWQYHERRGELWHVLNGPVGVVTSRTDEQSDPMELAEGQEIELTPLTRHRLIGLSQWGVVAEIWIHSDPKNPSAEEDNTRLEDEYGR